MQEASTCTTSFSLFGFEVLRQPLPHHLPVGRHVKWSLPARTCGWACALWLCWAAAFFIIYHDTLQAQHSHNEQAVSQTGHQAPTPRPFRQDSLHRCFRQPHGINICTSLNPAACAAAWAAALPWHPLLLLPLLSPLLPQGLARRTGIGRGTASETWSGSGRATSRLTSRAMTRMESASPGSGGPCATREFAAPPTSNVT